MSTLKQRFAELQASKPDITQADLSRATGAKPPSVNAWFTGETKSMKPGTAAKAAALYGVDPLWLATGEGYKKSAAEVAAKFGAAPQDLERNHALTGVLPAQAAINNIASIEQVMAALADYLVQMDDYARDNAADVLRRLTAHPEEHARAAALFTTAFQSGKQRAA